MPRPASSYRRIDFAEQFLDRWRDHRTARAGIADLLTGTIDPVRNGPGQRRHVEHVGMLDDSVLQEVVNLESVRVIRN